MKKESFQKLVLTGVFAALSYVVFTFLQIKIPLPGGDATSIHLGNAVCVLGALILGGLWGGIGGAIGMTIGDHRSDRPSLRPHPGPDRHKENRPYCSTGSTGRADLQHNL